MDWDSKFVIVLYNSQYITKLFQVAELCISFDNSTKRGTQKFKW